MLFRTYLAKIGGTIRPLVNSVAFRVMRADGTTEVFSVDTTTSTAIVKVGGIQISKPGGAYLSVNDGFKTGGPLQLPKTNTTSANYSVGTSDSTVLVDASAAPSTVNLISASAFPGSIITIKRINAGSNTVTVDANGTQTIDGVLTKVLGTQWSSITIQSDGSNWVIVSQVGTVT